MPCAELKLYGRHGLGRRLNMCPLGARLHGWCIPAIRENHLECGLLCRVSERVIRLHDVVHREAMSHELARLQLARAYALQQHRCGYRVHTPWGERNDTVPAFLH